MINDFKDSMLINTEWLSKNYSQPHIRIFDCTVWLKPQTDKIYEIVSGKPDYDKEHIPNSDFLNLEDISLKNCLYPFMMPNKETFNKVMSKKGVGPGTHVILYSRENIQWATRVWWMLKSMSFNNVSVLNGGFDKWKLENKPLSSSPIQYPKNSFTGVHQNGYFCNKEEVLRNINKDNITIINALRETLHNGSEQVNYGRPGHIKNSINIPSTTMINQSNKSYKTIEELKKIFNFYNILNKDKVIAYCGGGIAATNIAFVLTALGYKNISVYDASLSEWAKDNSLPMTVD